MSRKKCARCFRRADCPLVELAELTLPWISKALKSGGTEWERSNAIGRLLRGTSDCPGYVEDWLFAGAISHDEIKELVTTIARRDQVDLETLCQPCRYYQGPSLHGEEPRFEATPAM